MTNKELMELRLRIMTMLYEHGSHNDREDMFARARQVINFVATGNVLKKPVVNDAKKK